MNQERRNTPCEIIVDTERLGKLAQQLAGQREIAVDLEMDSLHHYREKVCLIQVSTRQENWLIDPLAVEDLAPLAGPLSSPETLVVMHGADYDVRSLHRDFGIEISRLFDTMIAARFLGITEFGLAALLKARFGIELDKKYQKADWSIRPLSAEMCAYAMADTSDLLGLHDQLRNELQRLDRLAWLEEECELVCQARVNEKDGPLFLYCKGAGKLKGRSLAVLEELLQLRDRQARLLDRPPFKVLSADTLLAIAEARPKTLEELAAFKGMTPGQIKRHGTAILAAIRQAMELPESRLPRFPRTVKREPGPGAKARLKRLKEWRERFSAELGLETGVVAPNWLLEDLAEKRPLEPQALDGITGMRRWQKQLYGRTLIELLKVNDSEE